MKPEPTTASHNAPHQPATFTTATASQHGYCRSDNLQDSLQPHSDGRQGEYETPTGASEGAATCLHEATDGFHDASRDGLRVVARPLTPPGDRITGYENALANSPPKPTHGLALEVVKSKKKPGHNGSLFAKLPNELLIEILVNLSPDDLADVSLVSRHFHNLITTPHAWLSAFARHFPCQHAFQYTATRTAVEGSGAIVRSEKKRFTRLSALASWRSEYTLRTRLLRSLVRGRPVLHVPWTIRHGQTNHPTITYYVQTDTIINHLQAAWEGTPNRRTPRLVHGADDDGMVTTSDPISGKVKKGRYAGHIYRQFAERFVGAAQWGLGAGDRIGRPNVMDVSPYYGMIYGQGCPEGSCYYRATEVMPGRFVAETSELYVPDVGIPKLGEHGGAICSVWLAKSDAIPTLSEGLIGMMVGSAAGVISACTIGKDGLRSSHILPGELTARWVLSPGVPIVAISVDEQYSPKRYAQNRIWAVALNALGELFYLTKFPTRSQAPKGDIEDERYSEYLAWLTGRSVYWNMVESSRRIARADPYGDATVDGSYSPRTSWDGMCLNAEQLAAETREIQRYLRSPPMWYRQTCLRWDMRRRLEVDFAGDGGNYAGEAMVVFECGLEDNCVKRFTRRKTKQKEQDTSTSTPQHAQTTSLFGGVASETPGSASAPLPIRSSSYMSTASSPERASLFEEWLCSDFTFGGLKNTEVTTTTLDASTFATLTRTEDPALGFSTVSTASSPDTSPPSVVSQLAESSDIPGQRARFVAAGTKSGIVILWDIRSPVSRKYVNAVEPIRIIYTDSPEISCLAMTSLYLVVGGTDGLVQAWDPLASTKSPLTTLHSRHVSRARRQLIQAQGTVRGVGINMFAAGAICLDPDPTVLRGAVSLGNHLRFWSYSSSAADQYKSSKRGLRLLGKSSNLAGQRDTAPGRMYVDNYIANEKFELERNEQERRKEAEHLAGRFGIDMLSEDEALEYAAMLSQEALEAENLRRIEQENSALSTGSVTPELSIQGQSSSPDVKNDEELDADIAEAIRLSLNESQDPAMHDSASTPPPAYDVPIKYAKVKKSTSSRSQNITPKKGKAVAGSINEDGMSDLELAMQLSLAEEQDRKTSEDAFPPLSPALGSKGKGRMWL